MAEIAVGQLVHAVVVQPRLHGVGHQHRVVEGRDADAVAGEDLPVVFHVLADLQDRRVLKHRLQRGQRPRSAAAGRRPASVAPNRSPPPVRVAKRDVGGLARIDAKRDADQVGLHLVQAGGFGIHRDMADARGYGRSSGQARPCRGCIRRRRGRRAGALRAAAASRRGGATCSCEVSGRAGAAMPSLSATRCVSVRNSISVRKSMSVSASGRRISSSSSVDVQRRVAVQRHQLRARCGSGRHCRPAPRGVWAA